MVSTVKLHVEALFYYKTQIGWNTELVLLNFTSNQQLDNCNLNIEKLRYRLNHESPES